MDAAFDGLALAGKAGTDLGILFAENAGLQPGRKALVVIQIIFCLIVSQGHIQIGGILDVFVIQPGLGLDGVQAAAQLA